MGVGGPLKTLIELVRKMFVVGGWAPALVFTTHVIATQVFDVYTIWPQADIPMHFAGGCAIAFFMSRCFQALPRDVIRSSRIVVLEAVIVASLTTSAAVLWEFAEFSLDRLAGTNVQVSLANTMQDMAMGMLGAALVVAVRAWQLGAGGAHIREVASDWLTGHTVH
jgi:hypothetical protein